LGETELVVEQRIVLNRYLAQGLATGSGSDLLKFGNAA
jgi:hypothetical protein